MTAPTNHTVTVLNRFGVTITGPVTYVKPLDEGLVEVHVESNFYIEIGQPHLATYATPSQETKGTFVATNSEFTERQTYIYKGEFRRADVTSST
jgi:hypothetical protein